MSSLTESGKAFINDELESWTPFLVERLRAQIRSRNIRESDELLHSVVAEVVNGNETDLSFLGYGRFHDGGYGPHFHKGQFMGNKDRRGLPPIKGRKPSKFYSRTAWGSLTTLINNLQNRYVEGLSTGIKDILTDGKA